MKKKYIIPILFLIVFFSSCSLIKKRINENLSDKSITNLSRQLSCTITNNHELHILSENENAAELAKNYLLKQNFSFTEELAFTILLHAQLRPDLVGPHSRIQILLSENDNLKNFHLIQENEFPYEYNLFITLENILRLNPQNRNLKTIIRLVRDLPLKLTVDKGLNNFLERNIIDIRNSENLSSNFTKGQQVLQKGESLPRFDLLPTYTAYSGKKNLKITNNNHLFDLSLKNEEMMGRCNFDGKLYENESYIIHKSPIKNSIAIALSRGKNKFALINIHQKIKLPLLSLNQSSHFQVLPDAEPASICILKSAKSSFFLLSNKGRDPSQLLFQLVLKTFNEKRPGYNLASTIGQARSQKLFLPERIIFESNKDESDELIKLNKLNIPLYHAENLGQIWGLESNAKSFHYYIDERSSGQLSCQN